MSKTRKWMSIAAAAQIIGCVPTVTAPTVVVTPGPGKSPSDFAADNSACTVQGNQQIAAAKNAANNQIAGTALLSAAVNAGNSAGTGAKKSVVAANAAEGAVIAAIASEGAAQARLQRQFDVAYSECISAKGDIIPGFTWALVGPGSASPASVPTLMQVARSSLLGVWRGSYVCVQGETGVELSFNELRDDGVVVGTFSFFNLPGHSNAASGEYTIIGQLDIGEQRVYLDPETWIRQPPGYIPVGLSISFPSAQTHEISGTITNPGCSQILVDKAGS
jgi:hypothetical protein